MHRFLSLSPSIIIVGENEHLKMFQATSFSFKERKSGCIEFKRLNHKNIRGTQRQFSEEYLFGRRFEI